MEYIEFGKTGLKVSKIGLGTLTMGGLQKSCSQLEIDGVTSRCAERGINFCDTAELYSSYNVAKSLLQKDKEAIVISKSYAWDKQTARTAVEDALRQIGREYIDVFLMHEQESEHTMRGHAEAREEYQKMQAEGKIGHIGVSTHKVGLVKDLAKFPYVEVCHPLINHVGFGLFDGTKEQMESGIESAMQRGVAVYAMKIFGGGHLLSQREEALRYLREKPFPAVLGMSSVSEVDYNCDMMERKAPKIQPEITKKQIVIHDWCELCGNCISHCPQKALSLEDGKVVVNKSKCVLCGYCGAYCENLCIKIF